MTEKILYRGRYMIKYKDLSKLREDVEKLVYSNRYEIRWQHIRKYHPDIKETEILNTLLYGIYGFDKKHEERYISKIKFPYREGLVKAAFTIEKVNHKLVVVITAFEEE